MTARAALLLIGLSACASGGTSNTDPVAVATAVRMDTLPTVVMTFPRETRSQATNPFHPLSGREVPGPNDTMMQLSLPAPLRPKGGTTTITMDFSFRVPEHGSDRLGRDGALYEIAQWYPRMAVYDDVTGWNTDPYLGQGEFYLEYGDIDFAITVPAGYTVAASGTLQNPREVLIALQRERLARAASTQEVVAITPQAEARARPALFDFAFREYIRSWAFKHPTPGDFFRTIENAAGGDLSWYWRQFWYTTELLDVAIDSVTQRPQEGSMS
ncbi:MAG TPA: hypothetical protein VES88_16945 [Gemmatimonadaceae bacterium]|nr:hypothetical protein [Gemmatimonadaceae bacterium]